MGSLGGAAVWRLPLAQGAILETRDRIPRRAPGAWSLLLPLPVSLPLSLSLCAYHEKKKKISVLEIRETVLVCFEGKVQDLGQQHESPPHLHTLLVLPLCNQ